jgi:hypothetical protein
VWITDWPSASTTVSVMKLTWTDLDSHQSVSEHCAAVCICLSLVHTVHFWQYLGGGGLHGNLVLQLCLNLV